MFPLFRVSRVFRHSETKHFLYVLRFSSHQNWPVEGMRIFQSPLFTADRLQIEEEANSIRIVDGRTLRQFKSKAAKVSCEIFARSF